MKCVKNNQMIKVSHFRCILLNLTLSHKHRNGSKLKANKVFSINQSLINYARDPQLIGLHWKKESADHKNK